MSVPSKWIEAGAHAAAYHGADDPRAVAQDVITVTLPYLLDDIADVLSAMLSESLDPKQNATVCRAIRDWTLPTT